MKNIKRIALIGAAILVTGSFVSLAFSEERYQDLQLFAKVLNYVEQYYVEPVDTHKLVYGAIKGMLAELDPHTNFLPPDIYKEFETETSGEFGGIGIEITLQSDVLTVISPIEDTPAWNAGIQAGDRIVDINGESTKGLSLAEAAQKLHGKNGEKIRLGIFRDGFDKPKQFVITRAVVKVHSAKYTDLGDGYGYIRLTSFIENSASDVEKAIKSQMKNSPKGEVKGVILDLRRNPGGLLDQAVKISDLFLEKGIIVSTIGRNPKDKEVVYAKKDGTYPQFPLIVLINEYSASASEIVAGALLRRSVDCEPPVSEFRLNARVCTTKSSVMVTIANTSLRVRIAIQPTASPSTATPAPTTGSARKGRSPFAPTPRCWK